MSDEPYTPIIHAVNATGLAVVWRNQSGRVRARGGWIHLAPKGTPDIVGWMRRGRPGTFVGLEVKVEAGAPTEEQIECLAQLDRAGGVSAIVMTPAQAVAVVMRAAGLERRTA